MMKEFYDQFHPTVKDVSKRRESGERILGTDPEQVNQYLFD
jgi:DNA topoisomerase-1